MLFCVVFGNDTRQQVTLCRDHLAVFIGILVENGHITLFNQPADLVIQAAAQFTRHVTVMTVFDVGSG